MSVPDFQKLMLPTLLAHSDGAELSRREIFSRVAESEELKPDELQELIPSGKQSTFENRVGWAITYLKAAGFLQHVRRGVTCVTPVGREGLTNHPTHIDIAILSRYPAFVDWRQRRRGGAEPPTTGGETPEETMEHVAKELRNRVRSELLARVLAASPSFVERVAVDLLTAMGYGGGDPDLGRVTGRSGDGGIDGSVREDALGLDEVYIQVKQFSHKTKVGEREVRDFSGALDATGTTKGVFVTTSAFSDHARAYVDKISKRIVLIDGKELARLMEVYNVGVRTRETIALKSVDEDYFELDG